MKRGRKRLLAAIAALLVIPALVPNSAAEASPTPALQMPASGALVSAWPANYDTIRTRRLDPVTHRQLCLDAPGGVLRTNTCTGVASQIWIFTSNTSCTAWPVIGNLANRGWVLGTYTLSVGSSAILRTLSTSCAQTTTRWRWDPLGNESYALWHTPAPNVVLDAAPVGDVGRNHGVTVNKYEGFVGTQSWVLVHA